MTRRGVLGLLWCVLVVVGTGAMFLVLDSTAPVPALAAAPDDGDGVLGPLNPKDPQGVPLDHYEITGDTGGSFDFGPKILLFFTGGLFALSRWVVGLATWVIGWVLDFQVTQYLLGPVVRLSQTIETHLLKGIGLPAVALTLAAVVCGWWIMRGHTAKGVRELLATLVIASLTVAYVAAPAKTVFGTDGVLDRTRDTSLEIAGLIVGNGTERPNPTKDVTRKVESVFTGTFVRSPHQMINYGVLLDSDPKRPHKCLKVYNELVKRAPGSAEPTTWDRMAECDKKLAEFNKNPTFDRLGASLLALVAALFVAVMAIVIALTLLLAQLWLIFEVLRLLVALVVGLIPGPGRAQLWKALGGLAGALMTVVASIAFMAVFVVLIRGLLQAARDQTLFVRFLLLDIALFCGIAWYRRLVSAGRNAAAVATTRLTGAVVGADPPAPRRFLEPVTKPTKAVLEQVRPKRIREGGDKLLRRATELKDRAKDAAASPLAQKLSGLATLRRTRERLNLGGNLASRQSRLQDLIRTRSAEHERVEQNERHRKSSRRRSDAQRKRQRAPTESSGTPKAPGYAAAMKAVKKARDANEAAYPRIRRAVARPSERRLTQPTRIEFERRLRERQTRRHRQRGQHDEPTGGGQ